ncbi:MAG: DUF1653 domain-containing protein [Bacteroidia bacterium]
MISTGKYKHYKGNFYEVIGTVIHSETLERMVLYKPLYDSPQHEKGQLWVRPEKMFNEKIIVEGKEAPRFEFVG